MSPLFARFHRPRLWLTLPLLLFAAGCREESSPPIRLGINPWPGYEYLHLASEKNFFQEEGVAVRIIEYRSLTDTQKAFERGQLDGFGGSPIEVLQAAAALPTAPQV